MGLDWNPGPKAKKGYEHEFGELWKRFHSGSEAERDKYIARFQEITQPAFDTLNVPTVGKDSNATDWANNQFERRLNKSLTREQFISAMTGFRVLELVPRCDGLPRYTNGQPGAYVEAYSFRGQFLKDCVAITGQHLHDSAWESKLPDDTVRYGQELLERADAFAKANRIHLDPSSPPDDPESEAFHLDVVYSAGRWCIFWGNHGHWLEAYF